MAKHTENQKQTAGAAAAAAAAAGTAWTPVTEKLPKPGVWVLVWTGVYHWMAQIDPVYGNGRQWTPVYENEYWHTPTHWMPLPTPPQGATSRRRGGNR